MLPTFQLLSLFSNNILLVINRRILWLKKVKIKSTIKNNQIKMFPFFVLVKMLSLKEINGKNQFNLREWKKYLTDWRTTYFPKTIFIQWHFWFNKNIASVNVSQQLTLSFYVFELYCWFMRLIMVIYFFAFSFIFFIRTVIYFFLNECCSS